MSKETNPQQNSAIEQRINEMVQQSRILEAYMNDIVTKEATIVRLIEEARLAASALHNIVPENQTESLVPVGVGVYMKALIPPIDKLLVNVGAGVTIEKSKQDAINYVESRIKEFEVASTTACRTKTANRNAHGTNSRTDKPYATAIFWPTTCNAGPSPPARPSSA